VEGEGKDGREREGWEGKGRALREEEERGGGMEPNSKEDDEGRNGEGKEEG